jgi:hypothetical protein
MAELLDHAVENMKIVSTKMENMKIVSTKMEKTTKAQALQLDNV